MDKHILFRRIDSKVALSITRNIDPYKSIHANVPKFRAHFISGSNKGESIYLLQQQPTYRYPSPSQMSIPGMRFPPSLPDPEFPSLTEYAIFPDRLLEWELRPRRRTHMFHKWSNSSPPHGYTDVRIFRKGRHHCRSRRTRPLRFRHSSDFRPSRFALQFPPSCKSCYRAGLSWCHIQHPD